MRVIKFRAWDEGHSIMHYDFQWIKTGNEGNDWVVFISDKHSLTSETHPFDDPYFSNQFKIMQFTGLIGYNDVEIYEGDIVQIGESTSGIVEYEEDRFFVNFFNGNATRVSSLFKVIGNIYENENLISR